MLYIHLDDQKVQILHESNQHLTKKINIESSAISWLSEIPYHNDSESNRYINLGVEIKPEHYVIPTQQ